MKAPGCSSAGRGRRRHALLFTLALALIFALQLRIAERKHYSFNFRLEDESYLFSEDLMGVLTHGRQFIEFGRTATFCWPGYPYHGPVEAVALFWPGLLFGFHEWIPVVMMAVLGTLIPVLCYVIARLALSPDAGLAALALTGATDIKLAGFVFMFAWPFLTLVCLSLSLAVLSLLWVRRYRRRGRQPGWVFCLATGFTAGVLFYAHPMSVATLLAVPLFLFAAMGLRALTWRAAVALAGAAVGSLRLWVYWLRYVPLKAFTALDTAKPLRSPRTDYFLSKRGFFWYLFSPSDNAVMRAVVACGVATVAVVVLVRLTRFLAAPETRRSWARCLRSGWPVPLWSYGVIFALVMTPLMRRLSGIAAFAGPSHQYACELWFWFMLALTAVIRGLAARSRAAAGLLLLGALSVGYYDLITRFPKPTADLVRVFEDFKADAREMAQRNLDPLIVDYGVNGTMYYAYAPRHLMIADGLRPFGLTDVARAVEQAPSVSVAAQELSPGVLGPEAWQTAPLRTINVYHDCRMPPSGRVLSNAAWRLAFGGGASPELELARDDNLSTSWLSPTSRPPEGLVWQIELEQPRPLCRLVIVSLRDEVAWRPYTYWRIVAYFTQTELFSAGELCPNWVRISGRLADTGEWVALTGVGKNTEHFWDGGRLFYDWGERGRLDVRFPPRTVTALRIEDLCPDRRPRKISELYVFESGEEADDPGAVDRIVEALKARGIRRLYAGRFISAQVGRQLPEVEVWRPSWLREPDHRLEEDIPWPWFSGLEPLATESAALVCEAACAPRAAEVLSRAQIGWRMDACGPWALITFTEPSRPAAAADLVWNGICPVRFPRAREQPGREVAPPAEFLSEPVVFHGGAELVAVEFPVRVAAPGDALRVRCFWKISPGVALAERRLSQFAHLVRDKYMINGDASWLTDYSLGDLRLAAGRELLVHTVQFRIPADAPRGAYRFETGLLRGKRLRLKPRTSNPSVKILRDAAFFDAVVLE